MRPLYSANLFSIARVTAAKEQKTNPQKYTHIHTQYQTPSVRA